MSVVTLWWIDLTKADEASSDDMLFDDSERERASQIRNAKQRRYWLYSHGVMRRLLAQTLSVDLKAITYKQDFHGKPRLANAPLAHSDIEFSFSDSAQYAALAISKQGPIGLDIERITGDMEWENLVSLVCAENERSLIFGLPSTHRAEAFFRNWVRKEALLKASGIGMLVDRPLTSLDVSGAVAIGPGGGPGMRWWLHDLTAPPGFKAAIATQHAQLTVEQHQV